MFLGSVSYYCGCVVSFNVFAQITLPFVVSILLYSAYFFFMRDVSYFGTIFLILVIVIIVWRVNGLDEFDNVVFVMLVWLRVVSSVVLIHEV